MPISEIPLDSWDASLAAKHIFGAALEIAPERRAEFLISACAGNTALESEVRALLETHEKAGRFLDPNEADIRGGDGASAKSLERLNWLLLDEQPGTTIDRYKLLEVIGEGGHGIVFRAEQEQPIRRQVALKVIRKGMETDAVRLRFEAERQTLALMDHPNIAKLFDAGTTELSRPYFVMELVCGSPLTRFCDDHRLTIRRRVELFITICRAVHHAHQKGVIHRDLKPSNVIIVESEGIPSPMVIDFGISLATSDSRGAPEVLQIVGTPQYMSPEQVATQNVAIDIRSDIYSLGAMLFELLTGSTPIGRETQAINTVQDLREAFAKQQSLSPSELVSIIAAMPSEANNLATISRDRAVTAPMLLKSLREDLDSIALKATHRDRALRYDSVAAMADDLQRYLDRRPVLAAPASASYLFRRFAMRNKTAVTLVLAVAACVMVSLCAVTLAFVQMRAARDRAMLAQQREARSEAQAVAAERLKAASEADAIAKLRESYVLQANAGERSRVPGQRTASLNAISLAAKISPSREQQRELRNTAIACMSLPDAELEQTWEMPHLDTCMRFSANMDRYAVSDRDGSVRVIRRSDRTQLAFFPGSGKPLYDIICFSPDAKYVATRDTNGLHLWDVSAQKAIYHRDPMPAFTFAKDGLSFVAGTPSGSLDFISLPRLQTIKSIQGVGTAYECRFDPTESRLAVWSDDPALTVVSIHGAGEVRKIKTDFSRILGLAWDPQGHNIALAGIESLGRIEIVNAETGKIQASMSGHWSTPVQVEFTHNGRFLLSCGYDGRVMLWDPASGAQLLTVGGCSGPLQVADNDTEFSVAGMMNHQIWRFTTGPECRTIAGQINDDWYESTDFSPDGTLLAAAGRVGVRVWNLKTGKEFCFLSLVGPRSVLFSPDGSLLFTTSATGVKPFKTADLAGREDPMGTGEPGDDGSTGALAASADFKTMVFGAPDRTVRVANSDNLQASATLDPHDENARFAAVSPDGSWAATSSRFRKTKVWNLKTKKLVFEVPMSPNIRESGQAAFDPSGKVLVTSDILAYRWYSVGDWKLIRQLDHPNSGWLAFSPDGKLLALAGTGFPVLLLDAQTGEELAGFDTPIPHNSVDIHFSRDSRYMLLNGTGGQLILWDLPSVRRTLASMNLDWK